MKDGRRYYHARIGRMARARVVNRLRVQTVYHVRSVLSHAHMHESTATGMLRVRVGPAPCAAQPCRARGHCWRIAAGAAGVNNAEA